jgi:hydroxypyruvate isomerase
MKHHLRFAANCSMLFTEIPLLERPAAAKRAGFDAVEFWWPFDSAVPPDRDVDHFVGAVEGADVQLVGLNFFAGDMPAGDRGVVSWPGRESEFRDNTDVVVAIGGRLGCRTFNALYGNRQGDVDSLAQDDLAIENLLVAAGAVAKIGGNVVVEPISGADRYPLLTGADALAVIERTQRSAGVTNVLLLADLYHLAVNGDDVDGLIAVHTDSVGHVQIADHPGRNEPSTGVLRLDQQLHGLESRGYRGWVGLEYKPSTTTIDSFAWLPHARRSARR